MNCRCILLIIFTVMLLSKSSVAHGQKWEKKYKVKSLESHTEEISVIEDLSYGRILLVCNKDSSYITDNQYGIKKITFLNNNILKILYGSTGGSGLHNTSLLLVGIKNKKPHIAMKILVESLYHDSFGLLGIASIYDDRFNSSKEKWSGVYVINIKSAGSIDSNNLHLNLAIRDALKTTNVLKSYWHDQQIEITLYFDCNEGVFFNNHKSLNGIFSIQTENTIGIPQKFFDGKYPVIDGEKLPTNYFIKGKWYVKNNRYKETSADSFQFIQVSF